MRIALCYARIIYIHFTSIGMSRAYIHHGIHDYPIANDICGESLDMVYMCVANDVVKTPTTKNPAIVMVSSKQFLTCYFLKSLVSGKCHHLVGSSLKVVMDKFNTLASPNYRNFVFGSKCFLCSRLKTMEWHSKTIMLSNSSMVLSSQGNQRT